ncbi:hypothetical protein [Chryseobacterium lactis]|uniref:hypothetical protein n=1 Tax=Chryseobacterium lactis TaxID=1241981 RepID=UPI001624B907|nr:hypothetical protein [Chryseobacterium lactis]
MVESVSFIQDKEIQVEFFLKKRNVVIDNLKDISKNWQFYFLRFNELNESQLSEYLEEDNFYIEGAIYLSYYGTELIGFKYWDLIDQLCSYFINSIYNLIINNKESDKFYFPDQPIEVNLKKEKEHIWIKIGDEKPLYLNKDVFIKEFLNACKDLYKRINIDSYKLEIDKIDEILKYLK